MKQIMLAGALAGLAFAFAVPAQAMVQDEELEETQGSRAQAKAKPSDRFCIQQTGSRVVSARNARSKADEKECVNAGGRVYTREDINRSGSIDLADALRKLDPSVR